MFCMGVIHTNYGKIIGVLMRKNMRFGIYIARHIPVTRQMIGNIHKNSNMGF